MYISKISVKVHTRGVVQGVGYYYPPTLSELGGRGGGALGSVSAPFPLDIYQTYQIFSFYQ